MRCPKDVKEMKGAHGLELDEPLSILLLLLQYYYDILTRDFSKLVLFIALSDYASQMTFVTICFVLP